MSKPLTRLKSQGEVRPLNSLMPHSPNPNKQLLRKAVSYNNYHSPSNSIKRKEGRAKESLIKENLNLKENLKDLPIPRSLSKTSHKGEAGQKPNLLIIGGKDVVKHSFILRYTIEVSSYFNQTTMVNIENDGSISSWNESISSKSKPNVIILMFDVSNSDTLYTGRFMNVRKFIFFWSKIYFLVKNPFF